MECWAPLHSKKMSKKKREILCDSTLTRACKPMTRSDSTVLVTRLDQVMTLTLTRKNFRWLWLEGLVTLTRQKLLGLITGWLSNSPFRFFTSSCFLHHICTYSFYSLLKIWSTGTCFMSTLRVIPFWKLTYVLVKKLQNYVPLLTAILQFQFFAIYIGLIQLLRVS